MKTSKNFSNFPRRNFADIGGDFLSNEEQLLKTSIIVNIYLFMKSFLTILLIAGIIVSAGVSLLVMDHHGNCIASSVAGVACPDALNPLTFFGIHLNFLRNLSEGLLVAVSVIFLLAFVYALILFDSGNTDRPTSFFNTIFFNLNNIPQKRKLIFWLSLLENSPAIL